MTEEIPSYNQEETKSTDAASIISTASSEFDPVQEIAFQLGVDFIEYSDFEDIRPIETEAKAVVKRAIWKEYSREVALKQILGDDAEEIHKKLETETRLAVDILAKKRREQPAPNTPEDYVKLYEDCWQHDSASRPTIDEVCDNMDELLKDDPLSAHLRKRRLTGSDEEEFTFEEEPLPQTPPVKAENGHAHLSNENREIKKQK
ncbi:13416_t:CDS:2 [Acaulospora colombiana]|uniref:13416_t:CDS:1 n=1 Tax=Acaulospora colombiana TaxID=27376 RepID=A0ACA9LLJ1_9GLOM|nr:13416_t:CDS:2 [Acaulospora colombiana]